MPPTVDVRDETDVVVNVRRPTGHIEQKCPACGGDFGANTDWQKQRGWYQGNVAFVHFYKEGRWLTTQVWHEECWEHHGRG